MDEITPALLSRVAQEWAIRHGGLGVVGVQHIRVETNGQHGGLDVTLVGEDEDEAGETRSMTFEIPR
jgi:hypothetical protein